LNIIYIIIIIKIKIKKTINLYVNQLNIDLYNFSLDDIDKYFQNENEK